MELLKELGGAQFVLTFTVLLIVALRTVLGLDDKTIDILTIIALGGSSALGAKNVMVARTVTKATVDETKPPAAPTP